MKLSFSFPWQLLGVVTSSNVVRPSFLGKFNKRPKLHVAVTHYVWIRCAALCVLGNKILRYFITIRCLGVAGEKWNIEVGRDSHSIKSFLFPVTHQKIRVPNFYKDPNKYGRFIHRYVHASVFQGLSQVAFNVGAVTIKILGIVEITISSSDVKEIWRWGWVKDRINRQKSGIADSCWW